MAYDDSDYDPRDFGDDSDAAREPVSPPPRRLATYSQIMSGQAGGTSTITPPPQPRRATYSEIVGGTAAPVTIPAQPRRATYSEIMQGTAPQIPQASAFAPSPLPNTDAPLMGMQAPSPGAAPVALPRSAWTSAMMNAARARGDFYAPSEPIYEEQLPPGVAGPKQQFYDPNYLATGGYSPRPGLKPLPPGPAPTYAQAIAAGEQAGQKFDALDAAEKARADAATAMQQQAPTAAEAKAWIAKNDPKLNGYAQSFGYDKAVNRGTALERTFQSANEAETAARGETGARLPPLESMGFTPEAEAQAREAGELDAYLLARGKAKGVRFHQVPAELVPPEAVMGWAKGDPAYADRLFRTPDGNFLADKSIVPAEAVEAHRKLHERDGEHVNTMGEEAKNVGANVGAYLAGGIGGIMRGAGEYVRAVTDTGGRDFKPGPVSRALSTSGKYLTEGSERVAEDMPVQTGVGQAGVALGNIATDVGIGYVTGPAGFIASYAGKSAGHMFNDSIRQGDSPDVALGKAGLAGLTAYLTGKLVMIPAAERAGVARTAISAYINAGSGMAAQDVLDQAVRNAGTGKGIDFASAFKEAAAGGLIGPLMHAGQIGRGVREGFRRVEDTGQYAQPGLRNPPGFGRPDGGETVSDTFAGQGRPVVPGRMTVEGQPVGMTSPGNHPIFETRAQADAVATRSMLAKGGRTGKAYVVERVGDGFAVLPMDRPAESGPTLRGLVGTDNEGQAPPPAPPRPPGGGNAAEVVETRAPQPQEAPQGKASRIVGDWLNRGTGEQPVTPKPTPELDAEGFIKNPAAAPETQAPDEPRGTVSGGNRYSSDPDVDGFMHDLRRRARDGSPRDRRTFLLLKDQWDESLGDQHKPDLSAAAQAGDADAAHAIKLAKEAGLYYEPTEPAYRPGKSGNLRNLQAPAPASGEPRRQPTGADYAARLPAQVDQRRHDPNALAGAMTDVATRNRRKREPWQMTRAEVAKAIGTTTWTQAKKDPRAPDFQAMHREAVEQAVAEGKPVPAEVLADYPDLASPPTGADYARRLPKPVSEQQHQPNELSDALAGIHDRNRRADARVDELEPGDDTLSAADRETLARERGLAPGEDLSALHDDDLDPSVVELSLNDRRRIAHRWGIDPMLPSWKLNEELAAVEKAERDLARDTAHADPEAAADAEREALAGEDDVTPENFSEVKPHAEPREKFSEGSTSASGKLPEGSKRTAAGRVIERTLAGMDAGRNGMEPIDAATAELRKMSKEELAAGAAEYGLVTLKGKSRPQIVAGIRQMLVDMAEASTRVETMGEHRGPNLLEEQARAGTAPKAGTDDLASMSMDKLRETARGMNLMGKGTANELREKIRAERARVAEQRPTVSDARAGKDADPASFARDVQATVDRMARNRGAGGEGMSNIGDKATVAAVHEQYEREHGAMPLEQFKRRLSDVNGEGVILATEDLIPEGRRSEFAKSAVKTGASEYHYVRASGDVTPGERTASASPPVSKIEAMEQRAKAGLADLRKSKEAKLGEARRQGKRPGGGTGGLDPQEFGYHLIIAAAKIARGAQRFTTWSKQMLAEFPDLTKAALAHLWREARRIVNPSTLERRMGEDELAQYIMDRITVPASEDTADTVRRSAGMLRDPATVRTELDALKVKLRAEARGARAGYRAGEASGIKTGTARAENKAAVEQQRREGKIIGQGIAAKAELRARMEDKAALGEGVRKELARLVRENLPAADAAKFLDDIAKADTMPKLMAGIEKARRVLADRQVKDAIDDLEELTGEMKVHVIRPAVPRPGTERPTRVMGDVRPDELKTVDLNKLPKEVRDEVAEWIEKGRYLKDRLRNAAAGASIEQKAAAVDAFREIDRQVRQIVANELAAREIRIGEKLHTRDKIVSEVTGILDTADQPAPISSEPTTAPHEGAKNLFGRKALSADAIFTNMLGRDADAYKLSIHEVRRAQSRYHADQRETHEAFEPAMKAAGIKPGSKALDDWMTTREGVTLPDAGAVKLTRSEMLHVVATAADPETAHLIARGVPWSFDAHQRETPLRLTPKDIAALRANLRPEELKLIDAFRDRNDQVTPAAIRARIDLAGSAPETHKGYFPRRRNRKLGEEAGLPEGWRGYMDRAMENISSMKDRSGDLAQPLMVRNFIDHVFDYFDDVAKLTHLAEPVRSLASVWQHPDVARGIVRKYGESMNGRINDFLRDTMRVSANPPAVGMGRLWRWASTQVARSALQLNPGPMLKNIGPGTLSLLPEFDVRDWAVGVRSMFSPAAYRRMMKGSGVAWERYHGGIYGAYTPLAGGRSETIADMTFGEASKAMASAVAHLKAGKSAQMFGRLVDALPFMEYADSVPLRAAWAASEHFVDRTRPGLPADERAAALAEKFEEAVYRTQNGSSSTEISGFGSQARGNPFLSAYLQFKSDSAKKYSMLAMMKNADASTRAKTLLSIGVGAAMSAGIGYGLKQGATAIGAAIGGKPRDPEQEKKMRDTALWGGLKDVAGIVPLGGLATGVGNMIFTKGHPDVASNPAESMIEGTIDGLVNVGRAVVRMAETERGSAEYVKAHDAMTRQLWKAATAVGTAAGVPLVPLGRLAERGYYASQYNPPDPRLAAVEHKADSLAAARKAVPFAAAQLLAERHKLQKLPTEKMTHDERIRLLKLDAFDEAHEKRLKELAATMDAGGATGPVKQQILKAAKDVDNIPVDERLLNVQDKDHASDKFRETLPADVQDAFRERAKLSRLGREQLTDAERQRLARLNRLQTYYERRKRDLVAGDAEAMSELKRIAKLMLSGAGVGDEE